MISLGPVLAGSELIGRCLSMLYFKSAVSARHVQVGRRSRGGRVEILHSARARACHGRPWLLSICPGRRRRPTHDDERASTSYAPRRDSSHRAVNGPLGTVKRGQLLAGTRMSLAASPSPSSISHLRRAMASATISGSHTRCQVWTSVFGGSASRTLPSTIRFSVSGTRCSGRPSSPAVS